MNKIFRKLFLTLEIYNYYADRLEMIYGNKTSYIGQPYTSSTDGSQVVFHPSTSLIVGQTGSITFAVPSSVEITSTGNVNITRTSTRATVSWEDEIENFSIQIGSASSGPVYGA